VRPVPRTEVAAARRPPRPTRSSEGASCGRRDAATLAMLEVEWAAGRSRAATASAKSWAADPGSAQCFDLSPEAIPMSGRRVTRPQATIAPPARVSSSPHSQRTVSKYCRERYHTREVQPCVVAFRTAAHPGFLGLFVPRLAALVAPVSSPIVCGRSPRWSLAPLAGNDQIFEGRARR